MKKFIAFGLIATFCLPMAVMAQSGNDDLYYVPSKNKASVSKVIETSVQPLKKETTITVVTPTEENVANTRSYTTTGTVNGRDVDEYNRRSSRGGNTTVSDATVRPSSNDVTVYDDGGYKVVTTDANNVTIRIEDNRDGGHWVGGFKGGYNEYEFASRLIRFRNPHFAVSITSPYYWDLVYGLYSWDWNIYVDNYYAYAFPTYSNPLWWDWHFGTGFGWHIGWNSWGGWHYGWNPWGWGGHYHYGWNTWGWGGYYGWGGPGWYNYYGPGYYHGYGWGGHYAWHNPRTVNTYRGRTGYTSNYRSGNGLRTSGNGNLRSAGNTAGGGANGNIVGSNGSVRKYTPANSSRTTGTATGTPSQGTVRRVTGNQSTSGATVNNGASSRVQSSQSTSGSAVRNNAPTQRYTRPTGTTSTSGAAGNVTTRQSNASTGQNRVSTSSGNTSRSSSTYSRGSSSNPTSVSTPSRSSSSNSSVRSSSPSRSSSSNSSVRSSAPSRSSGSYSGGGFSGGGASRSSGGGFSGGGGATRSSGGGGGGARR